MANAEWGMDQTANARMNAAMDNSRLGKPSNRKSIRPKEESTLGTFIFRGG